jgi:hypothetical protein
MRIALHILSRLAILGIPVGAARLSAARGTGGDMSPLISMMGLCVLLVLGTAIVRVIASVMWRQFA